MRISVIAVGRLKSGPETALAQQFLTRLTWPVTIREVEQKKKLPPAALRKREAELLLSACAKTRHPYRPRRTGKEPVQP